MSADTDKHGTGRKPCNAHQHFIQTDHMANKTQHFVCCVHCTDGFESCNISFAASIALMGSRRVFLVLMRPSMCEGKRTPWSHTCVSGSSTKCRTCRCLIRSPAPLKLNIPGPGLGHRLRRRRRPTTTAPSEHANSQSSSIVRLLF